MRKPSGRHFAVEPDGPARRRELDGVVEQVGDGLLDQLAVAADTKLAAKMDLEMDAFLLGHRAVQLGEVGEQRRRVGGDEGGPPCAGLDLGDAQQGLENGGDRVEIGHGALDATRRSDGLEAWPPRPRAGRGRG